MTHDTTPFETETQEQTPPLCLVHYFAERGDERAGGPAPPDSPLNQRGRGRVAERRGNLIILEFAPPPTEGRKAIRWQGQRRARSLWTRVCDALLLLLFFASLYGCIAAFRF